MDGCLLNACVQIFGLGIAQLLAGCSCNPEKPAALSSYSLPSDPDQVSCRGVIKTGTRISHQVCKSNKAWAVRNRYDPLFWPKQFSG